MTAPYIPPRKKSLRDALLAAQLEAPAPVRPDATGTRGYEMPRNLLGIRGTNEPMPRPARTGLLDRGLSALGSALTAGDDTPAGWAKELLSPLRQGAQAASLLEDSQESFRRNQRGRGLAQGLLSMASAVPSVPVDDAARGVRRLYHGSPSADIQQFDRLAPRTMPSKANRMDSAGTWFAESPDDVRMFTSGFDDAGQPMRGGVYEADVEIVRPREYASFDHLLDDFNRANNRSEWVGKSRLPEGSPYSVRGIADDGGNRFNAWLREQGYDGIKVTEPNGIDVGGKPQTYWMSLEPEKKAKIIKRPEK